MGSPLSQPRPRPVPPDLIQQKRRPAGLLPRGGVPLPVAWPKHLSPPGQRFVEIQDPTDRRALY